MISVLIVDDDFRVARIHRAYVDTLPGVQTVGLAHSGRDALRLAETLQPTLILLDLYLPDVFGLDLISRMRVAGVASDIMVISAASEMDTVNQAVKLGIVGYLLKPFGQADLTRRIEHYRDSAIKSGRRGGSADQATIDRVVLRRPSEPAGLPKGLSPETGVLVLAAIEGTDLSAQECAEAIGLSRVSARRYLEYYVGTGRAVVQLRYGSVGRPERRYRGVGSEASRG